ncbi:mannose-1-phosphate guanylyltransferase/mannose-6-phosphate isomerase [Lelliottia aquatilis]|uniref:mannose-1-phosphate guanylyltransferase/mannose-6-phosphate isomerase n=1 Tax=Lelliottia aquatilis TaxID=2080838 RepID=UPI000CDE5B92|nr:mannose-1-phosphate guanylyltransferase/mannose-6-phosphate isomerase [Lelliottia aquatilis]POZ19602.1 mannose-1-phosphate guanylyltransferase/mannose-6-phosphate isomerase [Lelliottia aquatilis]
MIQPIIIAGGTGSRLWPLSRNQHPKQFLSLINDNSLLQNTIMRLDGIPHASPIVVCNQEHRFLVAEQLRNVGIDAGGIILEPIGRNTAPAVALSAFFASSKCTESEEDPVLLVLAADHVIKNIDGFINALNHALPLAQQGLLVTFGVVPTHPETGYGYIQKGRAITEISSEIIDFKEKPTSEKAQEYIDSKQYLWNSGMFMFRASVYLEELKKYRSDIHDNCVNAMKSASTDLDFMRIDLDSFSQCPSESIDYAVMEKTDKGAVVSLDVGWSDVGSWSSLWDINDKDVNNNVLSGDVISHHSENCYVLADSALVTTIGVRDLVVVQTKDAVLIADRFSCQGVKDIVEDLKARGRQEHHVHREVYRPWGKYDSIDKGTRYQVKHITVNPGEGLSLQMHYHRAEHWVIVSGTAKVTINDTIQFIGENESIYIPLGAKHCLENPGKIPLDLIEVRSGAYLGEDDIVRFADRYGRI